MTDTRIADLDRPEGRDEDDAHPESTGPADAVDAGRLTRRGRVRKWDRPPPPHDWHWYVGGVGKVLISLGLLMFAFVAYQLWGTGIETARAQRTLEREFAELLEQSSAPTAVAPTIESEPSVEFDPAPPTADEEATVDSGVPDTGAPASDPAPVVDDAGEPEADPSLPATTAPAPIPVEDQVIPEVERGDALARLEIPSIGVDDIVVAGVSTGDLKKGPGHFPDTPLPGQLGNAAIAGHRTTYGQPFHDVDKLEAGDEIVVTTLNGSFTYRVTGQQIVAPSDYQVVTTTDPGRATLTLISCHPKWTAQQRIVIVSELDESRSGPIGEPVLNYGDTAGGGAPATELPSEDVPANTSGLGEDPGDEEQPVDETTASSTPTVDAETSFSADDPEATAERAATSAPIGTAETNEGIADAFADGWFSDPSANPHVGFWGVLLALVAVGSYLLSRRFRHDLIGLAVGIVPFVIVLYFFFQNVNRLLPPNL